MWISKQVIHLNDRYRVVYISTRMARALSLIVVLADRSLRWLFLIFTILLFICSSFQLAKDLLHPSPEEEKRRHKKKRLVQSPNSYFMDVKCPGRVFLHADWPHHSPDKYCHLAQFVFIHLSLWGNVLFFFVFVFFRMLQDHDSVQPRSDSCALCWLFNSPVSAHWRQSTSHRGSVWTYNIHVNNLTAGSTA